jgi:hypothetical protein
MNSTKPLPVDLDSALRARARQDPNLRAFAYTVSDLDGLGPVLGKALDAYLKPGELPEQVVVLPRQRLLQRRGEGGSWFPIPIWRYTPEVILIRTAKRLLSAAILEGSRLEVTSTPIDHIITIQLGTILLFSWFEWSWASDGKLETYRVYFNTVSDRIFRDLQQCLSGEFMQMSEVKAIPADQGLQLLDGLPYKFRNIIPLRLLLPREEIQAVVYRPAIWEPRIIFLRRQTSPATAVVLTDGQVLVAEEDRGGVDGHYGVIARYMPRHKLHRVALEVQSEGILLQMVFLLEGVEFELRQLFGFNNQQQLDRLLSLVG